MNAELPEKRETELSERYNRGEREGANREEQNLFAAYDRLREETRSLPAPEIDRPRVVDAMRREFRAAYSRPRLHTLWAMAPRVRAAAAILVIGAALLLAFLLGPVPAAMEIRFEDANATVAAPSWIWRLRAQFGMPVRVPSDGTATFTLPDDSVVIGQPRTVIAFSPGERRHVFLASGEVTVYATPNPHAPLTVSTPLGDARVIGTVFHVRVLASNQ